jgi:hypothetical protein
MAETGNKVKINRAPVMTLWAAVVAERLGYDRQAALTLGKGVAGLNAQSKGQRLGIFEAKEEEEKDERARERAPGEAYLVKILGRPVPVANTEVGVRATLKGEPIQPDSVERYLQKKFGENLPAVRQAMEDLAGAFSPGELERKAYSLYEKFRPEVPEGQRGWGAAGELDLQFIRSLKD